MVSGRKAASAAYWAGVDAGSPSAARTTIHAAIANHVVFPYSAGTTDVHDILNVADEDPTDTGRILDIYKNASYVKTSGGDTEYNKEHSWPKSYGFPVETTIPHSDCHHLFASDTSYNSNRSNKPFDTCSSGCTENATLPNHGFGGGSGTYPGNSNWTNGSVYEVWNHRRGDIARAQLYMDVRYEGGTHAVTGASEPDLVLTDNLSLVVMTSASPAYMGRLATLLLVVAGGMADRGTRRGADAGAHGGLADLALAGVGIGGATGQQQAAGQRGNEQDTHGNLPGGWFADAAFVADGPGMQ